MSAGQVVLFRRVPGMKFAELELRGDGADGVLFNDAAMARVATANGVSLDELMADEALFFGGVSRWYFLALQEGEPPNRFFEALRAGAAAEADHGADRVQPAPINLQ